MSIRLSSAYRRALVLLAACFSFALQAQQLQLVSVSDPAQGTALGGNGLSGDGIITPDGRFVLFASSADNLVLAGTNRPSPQLTSPLNVFLRDRVQRTTTLVSVDLNGLMGGSGDSTPMGISTNGRYVLFESTASNLVPADTNNASDVFVRDLVTGTTLLVSVSTNGGVGNGASQTSAMTPDGRFVVFASAANNLAAGDTNGLQDIFVRDLQTGVTTLVSVGAKSIAPGYANSSSDAPAITPDGRYVAFQSTATNLVPGVTTSGNIYLRDLAAGTTIWASAEGRAAALAVLHTTDVTSISLALSEDGRFVVYDVTPSSSWQALLLRYDQLSGHSEVLHTNLASGGGMGFDITPDAQRVAFAANADDTSGDATCILVWDAATGTTTLASGDTNNIVPLDSDASAPVIDHSGRFVVFQTSDYGLVTNALAQTMHLYVRDLQTAVTALVDVDAQGVGSGGDWLGSPALSGDGRVVVFSAPSGSLSPQDPSLDNQLFVRDLAAGATELASVHDPALPSLAPAGASGLSTSLSCVSAGSRLAVFWSEAGNVAANGNANRNIYLRDLAAGTNLLVSVNSNGVAADRRSTEPVITPDGRLVAFSSMADDLVPGITNGIENVYVRDVQAARTVLVSVSTNGVNGGNWDSWSPAVSPDGRYVLFWSKANNLAPSTSIFQGASRLLLRDLQTQTTRALSPYPTSYAAMAPDGRFIAYVASSAASLPYQDRLYVWDSQSSACVYTNNAPAGQYYAFGPVAIRPDGRVVVSSYLVSGPSVYRLVGFDRLAGTQFNLSSTITLNLDKDPGLRFSADGRFLVYAAALTTPFSLQPTNQVFLYDFQGQTNILVSRSYLTGGAGSADSDAPDISPDGRFVAFRSTASNLVPNDNNGVPDIFLYDRLSGSTTLVSANRFGPISANNRSLTPVFSSDGQLVFFASWASDLVAGDFNSNLDVFAYSLPPSSGDSNFSIAILPGDNGPAISWPVLPGKSYRVQYKNDLAQPNWFDANGAVSIFGGRASLTDRTAPTNRFYRVIAQ